MKTVFGIISCVILLFGKLMIFRKLGEEEWKALVPFYNEYLHFKHVWDIQAFWILMAFSVGMYMCLTMLGFMALMGANTSIVLSWGIASFIFSIIVIGIHSVSQYKLSICFGHGMGYTLGLIFLEPVFTLLLGVNEDSYIRTYA